jgi:hypothetical protein
MEFAFRALLFGEALAPGWPWALALCLFLGLCRGQPCGRGCCFIPERGKEIPAGSRWLAGELVSAADASTVASVFFDDTGVVFVGCSRAIYGSARRTRGPLPAWLVQKEEYVLLALDELGEKVARYFCQGALKCVQPGQPLPTIIKPKGSVPKKGKDLYRYIANGREWNKSIADWGSRRFTVRDLAAALSWRSIMHGFDISDGHHIAPQPPLTGCTGQLVLGFWIVAVRRVYDDDQDFDSSLRAAGGIGSRRLLPAGPGPARAPDPVRVRLAPPHWLLALLLLADLQQILLWHVLRWLCRALGGRALRPEARWLSAQLHRVVLAASRGTAGPESRRAVRGLGALHAGRRPPREWRLRLPQYGGMAQGLRRQRRRLPGVPPGLGRGRSLGLVVDGLVQAAGCPAQRRETPSVRAVCRVRRLDTFRGLMLVLPDKQALLLEQAASLGRPNVSWTTRELGSIKGLLLHQSVAVQHLRVLIAELQRLMGPVPMEQYDEVRPAPASPVELSAEMCCVLQCYAQVGCPIWPPLASSAYAALLREEEQTVFCSLTWDASTFGWAALARWWDVSGTSPRVACHGAAGAVARWHVPSRLGRQLATLSRDTGRGSGVRGLCAGGRHPQALLGWHLFLSVR